MELNINSPKYYKDIYGIDSEIYSLCQDLYLYFKEKKYSDYIDIIGIIPIIAHKELIEQGKYKEEKRCSLTYGYASVSLFIDYDMYVSGGMETKKSLIIQNVLASVKAIRTKGKFNFDEFKRDIITFCGMNNIVIG